MSLKGFLKYSLICGKISNILGIAVDKGNNRVRSIHFKKKGEAIICPAQVLQRQPVLGRCFLASYVPLLDVGSANVPGMDR